MDRFGRYGDYHQSPPMIFAEVGSSAGSNACHAAEVSLAREFRLPPDRVPQTLPLPQTIR